MLYSEKNNIEVNAKVTFEDGRIGEFNADVKIRDVATARTERSAG